MGVTPKEEGENDPSDLESREKGDQGSTELELKTEGSSDSTIPKEWALKMSNFLGSPLLLFKEIKISFQDNNF